MPLITFPDGSKKEFPAGTSPKNIAESIGRKLAEAALAAKFNGQAIDLSTPLQENGTLEILTFDSPAGKEVFWHSSSHVLAKAVKELWPHAKLTIGPSIEEGFYYDFDVEKPFSEQDLQKLEEKAKEIAARNEPFKRVELPAKEAQKKNEKLGEPYKNEIIRDILKENPKEKSFSFYELGEFADLCRGPHVPQAGVIKALKVLKASGAYWRGDVKNRQLQRIYGISFPQEKMLKEYLTRLEEAEKRDHRKLGRQLDLFSVHEEAPGSPFFHPNGMIIRNELEKYWREEHDRDGYKEVRTPIILNKQLWLQSGHWDHYKDNMYFTEIDKTEYAVKPMNCPGCILIYKNNTHSYRELPLRLAEMGLCHRHELSGVLSGLFRVRCFTQDDAHLFVTEEQVKQEAKGVVKLIDRMYKTFGFEYEVELSTRPEKFMGKVETWNLAEKALAEAMDELKMKYKINAGDGAFYGPKLDFKIRDAIGRLWQCATVQLDFQMPERFELEYEGADGKKHRPVMLHRVVYGAFERFMGVLIEHYAGAFPTWLAPTQVLLLPMTDAQNSYAEELRKKFSEKGVRVNVDLRGEKLEAKIRDAQMLKIPYMLVLGKRERENKNLAVRKRTNEVKQNVPIEEFLASLLKEISSRSLKLEAV